MSIEFKVVPSFEGLYDRNEIPCQHRWAGEREQYEVVCTLYYSRTLEVRKCSLCGGRIRTNGGGLSRENIKKGRALVREVALGRGEPDPGPCEENGFRSMAGSGWWLELPIYVCSLIDEQGIEKAREYVNWIFDQGSSRHAADSLYARCSVEV